MKGILLTSEGGTFSIEFLLDSAKSVLSWFLECFGSIFTFFLDNPGLLVFLVVSLVGTVLVYFRKLI